LRKGACKLTTCKATQGWETDWQTFSVKVGNVKRNQFFNSSPKIAQILKFLFSSSIGSEFLKIPVITLERQFAQRLLTGESSQR